MSIFDIFKKKQDPSEGPAKKMMAELSPDSGVFTSPELILLTTVRQTAIANRMSPKWETTNSEIVEVCKSVYRAFCIAEAQRGEHLDDRTLCALALYFLAACEVVPKGFVGDHIKYEAEKYAGSGLRDTYDNFRRREFGHPWDTFPFRLVLSAVEQGKWPEEK